MIHFMNVTGLISNYLLSISFNILLILTILDYRLIIDATNENSKWCAAITFWQCYRTGAKQTWHKWKHCSRDKVVSVEKSVSLRAWLKFWSGYLGLPFSFICKIAKCFTLKHSETVTYLVQACKSLFHSYKLLLLSLPTLKSGINRKANLRFGIPSCFIEKCYITLAGQQSIQSLVRFHVT